MLWSWLSSVPSQGCHRIESLLTHIALFSTDMLIMVFQDLNNKSQIQYDWVGAYHCGLVFFFLSYSIFRIYNNAIYEFKCTQEQCQLDRLVGLQSQEYLVSSMQCA